MDKEAEEIDNVFYDIAVFVVDICVRYCLRFRGGDQDQ